MARHIGEAKPKRKREAGPRRGRRGRLEASLGLVIAVVTLSYALIKARSRIDPGGRLKFVIALAVANVI
jgi:hypothetical protein